MNFFKGLYLSILAVLVLAGCKTGSDEKTNVTEDFSNKRWSVERVNAWYDTIPYPVGANYVPASAINQLEMWQEATFDPERINFELNKASEIGMNTMRVFLHDLAWKEDSQGFFERVDTFLEIAENNGIRVMFVLFDGVWNPYPKAGLQPEPKPHTHNSGWVQSPGKEILEDSEKQDDLKPYVQAVISRYKNDKRVLIWDLFNEPDNSNAGNYGGGSEQPDLPQPDKRKRALELMEKAYRWAREVNPSQPLTTGVWGKPTWLDKPNDISAFSLEHADVISFHSYSGPDQTAEIVNKLKDYERPVFCTEYMARNGGSTFQKILPILHENRVAAYNWGLFNGKSQTIYPWDSWKKNYMGEPDPWFHDVFRENGEPYDPKETRLIASLASRPLTAYENSVAVAEPDTKSEIARALKSHNRPVFILNDWIRDPYITKGPDEQYYLTGTTPLPEDPRENTDPYNLGLGSESLVGWKAKVWRSKDLVTWDYLGTPFDLTMGAWPQVKPENFKNVPESEWLLWAPELHWLGDRWALVHTSPSPVKSSNLSLTSGKEVAGPWDNPMGQKIGQKHDPSLFKDDDGTWWMIWGATVIAPLKPDFSDFAQDPVHISPTGGSKEMGHEGCLIQKIDGKYVLFGTGWSTGKMRKGSYNLYYAVADKITGPYSERKFVGRFLGHGTPFKDDEGKWWCTAFFNANLPPLPSEEIENRNLAASAYTINQRGLSLVPLDVYTSDQGELIIRAIPSAYSTPGPDEMQEF